MLICIVVLTTIVVSQLIVTPVLSFQTACPTWSAWSDVARCDSDVPACPTIIAAITPKTMRIAAETLQRMIKEQLYTLSHVESGKGWGVTYHAKITVDKYKEPAMAIHANDRDVLKLVLTDGKVTAKVDLNLEFKLLGKKHKKHMNMEIKLKIKTIVTSFKLDIQNNIPQLRFLDFEDDVNLDLNFKSGLLDIISNFLGGYEGKLERDAKKEAIHNIKEELQKLVDETVNPQFSQLTLENRFGDNFTLVWPFSNFHQNSHNIHVDLMAWIQKGPLDLQDGKSYAQKAAERQQLRSDSLTRQSLYLCHDDRFMIHIGFSEYFFNDLLYEAWALGLMKYSTTTALKTPEIDQLLKMTCDRGVFCIGQLSLEMSLAYYFASLTVNASIVERPILTIKDGYLSIRIDNLNVSLSVSSYKIGSIRFSTTLLVYPDVRDGRLVAKPGLTRFNLRLDDTSKLAGPEFKSPIFTQAIELIGSKMLADKLDDIFLKGFPLPNLDKTDLKNLTITNLDWHILQVSADYNLKDLNLD